jgi:hypothetical protein
MESSALPPESVRPTAKSAMKRIKSVRYDPDATLREARSLYFEANGFPSDGGYDVAWVDFELGPIPMPFHNSEPRRRAVKIHDLHHVLTGYATDIYGESEISAWELAAGCGGMGAAWVLNFGGMAVGMLIAPRRTFHAFVRGRQSRSLYRTALDDALLGRRMGAVRAELGLDRTSAWPRVADILAFLLYWQIGAWGSLAVMPLAVLSAAGATIAGVFRKRSEPAKAPAP